MIVYDLFHPQRATGEIPQPLARPKCRPLPKVELRQMLNSFQLSRSMLDVLDMAGVLRALHGLNTVLCALCGMSRVETRYGLSINQIDY
jgi:hypothetical protein